MLGVKGDLVGWGNQGQLRGFGGLSAQLGPTFDFFLWMYPFQKMKCSQTCDIFKISNAFPAIYGTQIWQIFWGSRPLDPSSLWLLTHLRSAHALQNASLAPVYASILKVVEQMKWYDHAIMHLWTSEGIFPMGYCGIILQFNSSPHFSTPNIMAFSRSGHFRICFNPEASSQTRTLIRIVGLGSFVFLLLQGSHCE